MDTRGVQESRRREGAFFEADLPGRQEAKKRRLKQICTTLPGHMVFASLDLNDRSFGEELTMHGLNTNRPTPSIPEAVTQYSGPEAVAEILKYIGQTSRGNRRVPPERGRRQFHPSRCR
jgi:O-methyltransferase involved in polyketide biosynthesis